MFIACSKTRGEAPAVERHGTGESVVSILAGGIIVTDTGDVE